MDWKTGVVQALEEFSHHKLRTMLTLLGMIFGVGAVISMLAIGKGAGQEALRMIDSLGLRNVIVRAEIQTEGRLTEIREDSLGLNVRDLEVSIETLPQVVAHTGVKEINVFGLFADSGASDGQVFGVEPAYFRMGNLQTQAGRLLDAGDEAVFTEVCVIGSSVARDLFGTLDPLGRRLKINHLWFEVVGVLRPAEIADREFEGVQLSGPQNKVFVPLKTALNRFRFKPMENELDAFHLEVRDRESIPSVVSTLSRLLETRHGGIVDYRLIVPQALLQQHRRTQRIFDIVMASIAGISLLVGGIGIMNIMLATVLERTREIGIRRAIGATRDDIRRQFLIEAFTISFIGGLLGIVVGFVLAWSISVFSGWPFAWSLLAPLVAVTVCAIVGLVFGLYPAIQASRLDPIEALNRGV
ncbi:MAG: ABC transporter permease [Acidobacteria bacterium]|nr:MAG: ABC transporter permease [Acidobacteriota bacterium]